MGRSIAITVSVFRPDVERDAEVAGFLPDLVIAYHTGKAVLVAKGLVGGDDGLTKVAAMTADPSVNPYIVGREAVIGYHEMWRACLSADIEQMIHDGATGDPTALAAREGEPH